MKQPKYICSAAGKCRYKGCRGARRHECIAQAGGWTTCTEYSYKVRCVKVKGKK